MSDIKALKNTINEWATTDDLAKTCESVEKAKSDPSVFAELTSALTDAFDAKFVAQHAASSSALALFVKAKMETYPAALRGPIAARIAALAPPPDVGLAFDPAKVAKAFGNLIAEWANEKEARCCAEAILEARHNPSAWVALRAALEEQGAFADINDLASVETFCVFIVERFSDALATTRGGFKTAMQDLLLAAAPTTS